MSEVSSGRRRLRLLLVGVGGQGVLTAARFLGDAALSAGLNVVLGQIHDLSQRGGSVRSSVLIGPGQSSFIGRGEADVVVGLEPLETLRARPEMSPSTRAIVNLGAMVPPACTYDGVEYPGVARILADIRAVAPGVVEVDGPAIVRAAGLDRTLNIAMLGVLAGLGILPFDAETLWRSVERGSRAQYLEPNHRAFALGREAAAT